MTYSPHLRRLGHLMKLSVGVIVQCQEDPTCSNAREEIQMIWTLTRSVPQTVAGRNDHGQKHRGKRFAQQGKRTMKELVCFTCREQGHMARHCPSKSITLPQLNRSIGLWIAENKKL
jgi:hypothetical protein